MATYRSHNPEDIEPAIFLISDVYREVLGREINKFIRGEMDRILQEFDYSTDILLIAEEGGEIVGTVLVEHDNPEEACCNMQFLVVHPDHRGKGHGRELVTRGLAFAKRAGYRTVELNVTADFEFALKMYERMGFKHVDTYLWRERDVLTFEKFL